MPDDGFSSLIGLSQRLPPSSIQAEQALLGALLANNKMHDRVAEFLKPEHFADPVHGRIYTEIDKMVRAGRLADGVTLKAKLEHSGALDDVGGTAYIAQLMASMIAPGMAADYARTIRNDWLRRELIDIGETTINTAFADDDADAQITASVEALLHLGESAGTAQTVGHAAALAGAVAHAEKAYKGVPGHSRLDAGIAPVDAILRGLWPGELTFLMARSRTGKTPAMMQITRHVARRLAVEGKGCVHVFSLEMDAPGIARLGLAATTQWDVDALKSGEIGDWHALAEAERKLADLPIEIDDTPRISLPDLFVRARVMKRRKDTRLIVIDFRQLISRPPELMRMPMLEWIPHLSYELKKLARTLNVPVLVLEQINKSRDNQDSTRPTLGDLPFGGDPAADAVCALWRPELTMGDEPPRPVGGHNISPERQAERDNAWHAERDKMRGIAEFIACKRRGGGTGFCRLKFDGPRQLLRPIEVNYDMLNGGGDGR